MLRQLLESGNAPLLKQTALFAERRQEVLAGNVANIDTPGYRLRDLPVAEFQKALRTAVALQRQQQSPASVARYGSPLMQPASPGSMDPVAPEELFPRSLLVARPLDEQPGLTFQDANNRSIEHQVMQITQNSILQNFALQLLSGQYRQLETVIGERVA